MESSRATEFPLDNPLLARGASWVCASTRGRALPTRRRMVMVTPILLMPEGAVVPPHTLQSVEAASEPVTPAALPAPARPAAPPPPQAPEPAAPADSSFQRFVQAMVQVLAQGGQTRAAALLPGFFEGGTAATGGLSDEAVGALRGRGILEPEGHGLSEAFSARAQAWRHVIDGQSDDLSACGDATLDSWAAELLCALAGVPQTRSGEYRRALRQRGVAAFGLFS